MSNMKIYNAFKGVPSEAKKSIAAGRLKGFTDINPMWRIKKLTELFGPCGFGWKYTVTDKRLEEGAEGCVCAFVDVNLYIKDGEAWSEAIPGMGGSAFVAKEKSGLYTSDECFKMALTDALSVAFKALGGGADVYWDKDRSKYSAPAKEEGGAVKAENNGYAVLVCAECGCVIEGYSGKNGAPVKPELQAGASFAKYGKQMCLDCTMKEALKTKKNA